jgi:hypothetical protein
VIVHDLNCPEASGETISELRADANYAINRDGWMWSVRHPKKPIDVIVLIDGNNERLNDNIRHVLQQFEDPEWERHSKDCPGSYVAQEVKQNVRPSRVREDG